MDNDFSYSSNTSKIIPDFASEKISLYSTAVSINDVQEPIISATLEVRQIIERVLQTEKDKLYLKNPRNINDDILKIIKEVVQ
ncbi:MAG: hypothetical protein ABI417_22190 [Coleofasciculaceae cyanobacterium]|jgi:hypothetical protein